MKFMLCVLNEKNLKALSGIHSHSSFSYFFGGWIVWGFVFIFFTQLVFGLIVFFFFNCKCYLRKCLSQRWFQRVSLLAIPAWRLASSKNLFLNITFHVTCSNMCWAGFQMFSCLCIFWAPYQGSFFRKIHHQ